MQAVSPLSVRLLVKASSVRIIQERQNLNVSNRGYSSLVTGLLATRLTAIQTVTQLSGKLQTP